MSAILHTAFTQSAGELFNIEGQAFPLSGSDPRHHLLVEAGTGTGKTMAYLYPALRYAIATGKRIIVSTGTKNLQEQLFYKDVPLLDQAQHRRRSTIRQWRSVAGAQRIGDSARCWLATPAHTARPRKSASLKLPIL